MPRVSNEYGVLDLNANENHSNASSSLLAFFKYSTARIVSFGTWQNLELAGRTADFLKLLLKAHYYPVYYIMAD